VTNEEELPPGGEVVGDDPPWDPWTPSEVAERLRDVTAPWAVAAGWALDLFAGSTSREHEDLEIAVPIGRFDEIHTALAGFEFWVVGSGHRWPLDHDAFTVMQQTWVMDPATGVYHLDVFREPHDGDTWICRRDERIRMSYRDVIARASDGIPFLIPEVVLLFKAKHDRPKDETDFQRTLPLLTPAQRAWLASALALVHPGHRWLPRIGG
jgi:hypothetical protein